MYDNWSNIAKVTYKRTYAREVNSNLENWEDTLKRAIKGNISLVSPQFIRRDEQSSLLKLGMERKATFAGRGLWFSGTDSASKIGGAALNNCWVTTSEDWNNLVMAQDLLMLGGGVGLNVEHRFTSKLPRIKKNVIIRHEKVKDADFIVPDSREGWNELTRRVLESFWSTGKSFTYSTICLRGRGEKIKGFGGKSSGPIPLIEFVAKLCDILESRSGKHARPIDIADIMCLIGEMVVSGNVRRSAILILGDPWDKDLLKAKRWDLGPVPNYRSRANFTIVCDDADDLHPLFWKTFEHGEPFGIFNRLNAQKYGRMGEIKKDKCIGVNPCAEATLEDGEPCNLAEIFLSNIKSVAELVKVCKLMTRAAIRTTCAYYHHKKSADVVRKNRRIGIGITGCLQSPLFTPEALDAGYKAIEEEAEAYCNEMGISRCIRLTVVKPSGTLSLIGECTAGAHPAYSRYLIRRIRFSSNDPLLPLLRESGHFMEPEKQMDGSYNHDTVVVDFYMETPEGIPCADEGFDTWKQLDTLIMLQKHWADQAVSCTVYYKKEDLPKIKEWVSENISKIKTVSFLLHTGHGFTQAPLEPISKEDYERLSTKIKPLDISKLELADVGDLEGAECVSGACPVK